MVIGIVTKKVTVTLEADQLSAIRALVEARSTTSVSAFVQHAVAVSLNDVAGCGALLASALDETGGPLTRAERAWADDLLLKPQGQRKRTRSRAA
jgi:hypothetical protein